MCCFVWRSVKTWRHEGVFRHARLVRVMYKTGGRVSRPSSSPLSLSHTHTRRLSRHPLMRLLRRLMLRSTRAVYCPAAQRRLSMCVVWPAEHRPVQCAPRRAAPRHPAPVIYQHSICFDSPPSQPARCGAVLWSPNWYNSVLNRSSRNRLTAYRRRPSSKNKLMCYKFLLWKEMEQWE